MTTSTRIRLLAFALAVCLILSCQGLAGTLDAAAIDRIVQEALAAWGVPGASVAIVQGDEVVYIQGFGVKELGKAAPVTADTIFAIGSTTKAFVSAAMAILVDEGKMSWDDPVRKHLASFRLSDPLADDNVTMRDLVSHRTGLGRNDMLWYASPWSREEIVAKIGRVKLSRPFRAQYQYQNIMFLTAGQAVGAAAATTWENFTRTRIFEPLGMNGANFSVTEAQQAPDHASPHSKPRDANLKVIPWRNIDNVGPAGSINASTRDLSNWVRMQLADGLFAGKRIVSQANLRETRTPQTVIRIEGPLRATNPHTNLMSYGMGWRLQDYHGRLMVSHGGRIDGFSALVTLIPSEKLGIVFLSNRGNTQMDAAVNNSIVDLALGLPSTQWTKVLQEQVERSEAEAKKQRDERDAKRQKNTKPSRELAAYTGTYEDSGYGTANIALEKDSLVLRWSSFKVPLEHYHYNTYRTRGDDIEEQMVVFQLGADGEVASFDALGVTFAKVKPRR